MGYPHFSNQNRSELLIEINATSIRLILLVLFFDLLQRSKLDKYNSQLEARYLEYALIQVDNHFWLSLQDSESNQELIDRSNITVKLEATDADAFPDYKEINFKFSDLVEEEIKQYFGLNTDGTFVLKKSVKGLDTNFTVSLILYYKILKFSPVPDIVNFSRYFGFNFLIQVM